MQDKQDEQCYKYMRLTTQGLAVSETPEPESFRWLWNISRAGFIFNSALRIFIGDKTLNDVIVDAVVNFLSRFLDFDPATGTLTIRAQTRFINTVEADKAITLHDDVNVKKSLTVEGDTTVEGDIHGNRTITIDSLAVLNGSVQCNSNLDVEGKSEFNNEVQCHNNLEVKGKIVTEGGLYEVDPDLQNQEEDEMGQPSQPPKKDK